MGGGGGTGTTLGGISGTELGDSLRTLCLISWDKIKRTMHTQRTARVPFDGVAQDISEDDRHHSHCILCTISINTT